MARRRKIMGLPIGRRRNTAKDVLKLAGKGAVMAAPAVATPLVRRGAKAVFGSNGVLDKGRETLGKASDISDASKEVAGIAGNIKSGMGSHSTTLGKAGGALAALGKGGEANSGQPKLSHIIEQHTDIAAPRSVVYNQWTQLELFPTIAKGVESVDQQSDEKLQWSSKIGPSRRAWTAKITEQIPDERIVWKAEGGTSTEGVVTFHDVGEGLTRVMLQMVYKPTGAVEWVGNTLRIQRRRVKRDLRLFKHFVEVRGEETGAWRGQIGESAKASKSGSGKSNSRSSSKAGVRSSSQSRSSTARSSSNRSNNGGSSRRSNNGSSSRRSQTNTTGSKATDKGPSGSRSGSAS